MNNQPKTLNDRAWEALFKKYDILSRINSEGKFEISSSQIKEFREPRLMAKFDHAINLPKIFSDNKLAILPITRGDYVISNFRAYHNFEDNETPIVKVSLPSYIQSLEVDNVASESVALNCAVAAGIVEDFLEDEDLVSTVSGRMGSGVFDFGIQNLQTGALNNISVNNSQIEIDGAYEGVNSLALFEAKRDLSTDFLIRQLYYPYRVWRDRVSKDVRPIFLVYSNGIYRLSEYAFEDPTSYNSLTLIKQKKYSIEDTTITTTDIEEIANTTPIIREPETPFPQADRFDRVVNICELLLERELSRNDVTEEYAFDVRQTNYYTDAGRYLGLVEKYRANNSPTYRLTTDGKTILHMTYRKRQLELCRRILQHRVFAVALRAYFDSGIMPARNEIIQIMKNSNLYNVGEAKTFTRRASTVSGWINWIIELIND